METLERGFLINVFSEKNCPGMLVSILEAFEELGLDVLDARVSCEDTFQLEAVGGEVRYYMFSIFLFSPLQSLCFLFFEKIFLNI